MIPAGMVFAVAPIAAVIMGDSLMYVVLPVAADDFGVSDRLGFAASFWIGLALSINRFIRLVSNATAASVYQRFGVRWPFVASIAAGALTTLAYGLGRGLALLLLARAVWGISYSFMRLAAHLTAFGVGTSDIRGRLMGFFNSGQRLGSLIAVTAGAMLFQITSREATFAALAGVGLLGVVAAVLVPDLRPGRMDSGGRGFRGHLGLWTLAVSRLPDDSGGLRFPILSISLMRFATAFAANGLAIATVAPYLAEVAGEDEMVLGGALTVVTLSGILIGFRWFSDLGLGVPLGHLSDRIGRRLSIAIGMAWMFAPLSLIAAFDSVIVGGRRAAGAVYRRRGSERCAGRGDGRDGAGRCPRLRNGQVLDLAGPGLGPGPIRRIPDRGENRISGRLPDRCRGAGGLVGAVRDRHRQPAEARGALNECEECDGTCEEV